MCVVEILFLVMLRCVSVRDWCVARVRCCCVLGRVVVRAFILCVRFRAFFIVHGCAFACLIVRLFV